MSSKSSLVDGILLRIATILILQSLARTYFRRYSRSHMSQPSCSAKSQTITAKDLIRLLQFIAYSSPVQLLVVCCKDVSICDPCLFSTTNKNYFVQFYRCASDFVSLYLLYLAKLMLTEFFKLA